MADQLDVQYFVVRNMETGFLRCGGSGATPKLYTQGTANTVITKYRNRGYNHWEAVPVDIIFK